MLQITEQAVQEIERNLDECAEAYIRISVAGGGCSGFNYVFDFEKTKAEDDFEIGKVLVDSLSMQYLSGATVKFEESLMGSQFVIDNPNATTTCGCGSSFSV